MVATTPGIFLDFQKSDRVEVQHHATATFFRRPLVAADDPAVLLHARSGRAYVTIAGRQVYLGRYGSPESRGEYDRVIAEWLSEGRPCGGTSDGRGLSINELILAYVRLADQYYRELIGERTSEYDCMHVLLRELKRL